MRLIDADALKRECEKLPRVLDDEFIHFVKVKDITKTINNAPTIEAEQVRHGRWLTDGIAEVCDQCGFHIVIEQYSEGDVNYCPNCWAKMDGGAKE